MLLFDRLRDPFFEPRHARFEFVDARIDLVEGPHSCFQPRDIVAHIEHLPVDVVFQRVEPPVQRVEPSAQGFEPFGNGLVHRPKPGENVFIFHGVTNGTMMNRRTP